MGTIQMTNLERLEAIRTHRARTLVMYNSFAAPIKLSGKVTGSMAIKIAYEQADREEYALKFKRILDSLDRQEREVTAKLALEEVSA